MKVSIMTRKSLIAAAIVAPLALAACGSTEDVAQEETTATPSSTTSASAAETTTSKKAEEKESTESKPSEPSSAPRESDSADMDTNAAAEDPNAGSDAAANNVEDPFAAGVGVPEGDVAPIEGGQPGTEADAAAIRGTLEDIYAQDSLHGMIQAVERNTCEDLIAANGGHEAFSVNGIPDASFSELGMDAGQNGIDSVSDVQVNGDTASATVTVRTQEGTDTATQRFRHEGGQWKMCN